MRWQKGDKARIVQDDPVYIKDGLPSRIGQKIQILATQCGGFAHIKVRSQDGSVFYVRPSWIRAENQGVTKKDTVKIRKQAEDLAEKRMQEILQKEERKTAMENNKPTFKEVSDKFLAISKMYLILKDKGIQEMDTIIALAEKGLYEEIKEGVRWE